MQINIFYRPEIPKYYRKTSVYKNIVLKALGKAAALNGEVNIVFVGEKEIHQINRSYIGHDYVTDVISFNYPFDKKTGGPFGDVFVCTAQAKRQAAEQKHSALFENAVLAAHGSLHLVGWDDATLELRNKMNSRAESIVSLFL
ncbi:MAG: rRNA maturation RNase YbeY [Elusimicrobiaceae bacterium]|nr:rRNA maturation RNase YbeY [Elusimicrobiota bacterium]